MNTKLAAAALALSLALGAPAQAASVDQTPIGELMARPETRAVLEKHLPGIEKHPSYNLAKSMTLKQVAPYSGGVVTPEKLAAIQADLEKLK